MAITFVSGLRISWAKNPFRSSRWALQHGVLKYVFWVPLYHVHVILCFFHRVLVRWTLVYVVFVAHSPLKVFVPKWSIFLAKHVDAQNMWNLWDQIINSHCYHLKFYIYLQLLVVKIVITLRTLLVPSKGYNYEQGKKPELSWTWCTTSQNIKLA